MHRKFAREYNEKELQAMTEIQLINLRCEGPEDVRALSTIMYNGRKMVNKAKKLTKVIKSKIEAEEAKIKEDLAKMKELNKFDESLQEEIEELERNFNATKAKKLISEIMT
jgi:hypothetical protein